MLLEYWSKPEATRDKFAGEWLLTGDLGRCDDDGYYWYMSRADDVITSAGYRIGPGEVEDALNGHPAVSMSAVIGVPDPIKTEAIMPSWCCAPTRRRCRVVETIRESVRSDWRRVPAPDRIRRCLADDRHATYAPRVAARPGRVTGNRAWGTSSAPEPLTKRALHAPSIAGPWPAAN
jgi:acyl-coenzyme A synthetase/AMP-(fatty) acid ligase